MRYVLEAKTIGAIIFFLTLGGVTAQAECLCGIEGGVQEGFFYNTVDENDAEHMEDFPWEVFSVEPIFDLEQPDEPAITCYVQVNLVAGDHPAIDEYVMTDDGEDTVFYNGVWVPFTDFEAQVRPLCTGAGS